MKKTVIILLAALGSFACKKDTSSSKQFLLGKVYADGLLNYEYLYDSDKKPYRRTNYSTGTGMPVFAGFRLYQYDGDRPKEATEYNKENELINRYVVQYDINNRPTRMDYYNSSNTLQTYYVMDYNVNGKLASFTGTDANTLKNVIEAQFKYNADEQVSGINRYTWEGTTKLLFDSAQFVFDDNQFPAHWSYYEMLPIIALPNGDKTIYEMYTTSYVNYHVEAPPFITTVTYANKTYNDDGLLTQQQITYSNTNGGPPTVNSIQKTYEYIQ